MNLVLVIMNQQYQKGKGSQILRDVLFEQSFFLEFLRSNMVMRRSKQIEVDLTGISSVHSFTESEWFTFQIVEM